MLDIEVDLVGDFGTLRSLRSLAHEKESCGQNDHKRNENSLEIRHVEPHLPQ
jgi:hypothetical protein